MTPFDLMDEIVALIGCYAFLALFIRLIAGWVVSARIRRERRERFSRLIPIKEAGYAADFVRNPEMYCV